MAHGGVGQAWFGVADHLTAHDELKGEEAVAPPSVARVRREDDTELTVVRRERDGARLGEARR